MKNNLRYISSILITLGVIVVLIAGIIGMKSMRRFYRQPPIATRQTNITTLRPWMTIGYISRTYGVPEAEIESALLLDSGKYHRSSISQIAKILNQDQQKIITNIGVVIESFQKLHPSPPVF